MEGGGAGLCCPLVQSLGGGALRGFSEGGIRGVELAWYHMEAYELTECQKGLGSHTSPHGLLAQAAAQTLPLEQIKTGEGALLCH